MSLMKHLLVPDFYLLFPDSFNVLDHLSLRVTALKSHPDVECWRVHADVTPPCLSQSLGLVLAWAAITRHHTWRPRQQTRISYGSGGSKVKTKVPAGLVSGEIFLPGLPRAALSLCPHVASLCVCTPSWRRLIFLQRHQSYQIRAPDLTSRNF